ncbi:hypothetical protein pipiens_006604 [Culex pipiens pipiens]|uniref:DAN domain-containing protein n=1 Tax=Culex pipiens pipiens TaxID=38569 RepID=A0ABD1DNT9_CULPP
MSTGSSVSTSQSQTESIYDGDVVRPWVVDIRDPVLFRVTPVIHVLQYPGCVPKPIPSFACVGRCASYIQVSGSKIWQMERSCMCCQESGEREASVSLFCPKAKNGEKKFKKVWRILAPRGVGELLMVFLRVV